jgi:hypothetical protein
MDKSEQTKKSKGGMARRMNDFYFELKSPDGKVEVFERSDSEEEDSGLQN